MSNSSNISNIRSSSNNKNNRSPSSLAKLDKHNNYPGMLHNVADFLEFHCYMRNREGIEVMSTLYGEINADCRIGVRVAIAALYLEFFDGSCTEHYQHETSTEGKEEEEEEEKIAPIVDVSRYSVIEWSEIIQQFENICHLLKKPSSRKSTLPHNPHEVIMNGYEHVYNRVLNDNDNDDYDENNSLTSEESFKLTPEQESILEVGRTKILDEIRFHQCLSVLRVIDNSYNESTAERYRETIESIFEEGSSYKDRLNMVFKDSRKRNTRRNKKMLLKSYDEVNELLQSIPFSLDIFRDSFGSYLSELENTCLGLPVVVKLGYTQDLQPHAVPGTFDCEFCKTSFITLGEAENCEKSHAKATNQRTTRLQQIAERDTTNELEDAKAPSVIEPALYDRKAGMMNAPKRVRYKITFDDSQDVDTISSEMEITKKVVVSSPRKRRRFFTDEEDRAIMCGCKRFADTPNIWASIRDHYAIFCDTSIGTLRTGVQLKDRARTLCKKLPHLFVYEKYVGYVLLGDVEEPISAENLLAKAAETSSDSISSGSSRDD